MSDFLLLWSVFSQLYWVTGNAYTWKLIDNDKKPHNIYSNKTSEKKREQEGADTFQFSNAIYKHNCFANSSTKTFINFGHFNTVRNGRKKLGTKKRRERASAIEHLNEAFRRKWSHCWNHFTCSADDFAHSNWHNTWLKIHLKRSYTRTQRNTYTLSVYRTKKSWQSSASKQTHSDA